MFSVSKISNYLISVIVIMVVSYVGTLYKQSFESLNNDDYELIRKYLLNDSPLYGFNKPKLWIHTKYEYNARDWESFGSRSNTELNQPYIHLCIKTIIGNCGDDFHIILIDDGAFSKLIPSWDIDVSKLVDPSKQRMRELGLANLLYIYGGIVVPNSFVCNKNLKELYNNGIKNDLPFVCEIVNRNNAYVSNGKNNPFIPHHYFMGSRKNNKVILDYIKYLKIKNGNYHLCAEFDMGSSTWFLEMYNNSKINIINSRLVGVKTKDSKPILIDELFEEEYINIDENAYGVYIPADDVLIRSKFLWFAYIKETDIIDKRNYICRYISACLSDLNTTNNDLNQNKNVMAI